MTNQAFLQKYLSLQFDVVFDQLIELSFATIAYCNPYSSVFFNFAQLNRVINQQELAEIESNLSSLKRKSALYFELTPAFDDLQELLKLNKYQAEWRDSWMFYHPQEVNSESFHLVKKVETKQELQQFLHTFDKCYQQDDPQNPYGELGNYLKIAKESWLKHHKSNKIEYFLVFKNEEPVAVSTLTNFEDIGYISNVGSLRKVRGQGFGKIASLYAVYKSQQNGNKFHTLATEEGNYPHEFYNRLGFETKFQAGGYVK